MMYTHSCSYIYSPELKDQQYRDSLGKLMLGYFLPFKVKHNMFDALYIILSPYCTDPGEVFLVV